MKRLSDIGEDALIERLVRLVPLDPNPASGPGDDCAVIDPGPGQATLQLLKTDVLVEHIHFLPDAPPRAVGWKAAARVVSDFAAMGGRPERFLITLALPPQTPVAWVEDLYRGIGACLQRFGGVLAGGETSSVPPPSAALISIAATGSVRREHLTRRSTAKSGQSLLVTGRLGGSRHAKPLDFTPRLEETNWLVSNFKPTAMMDLSDGLARDLPRLAAASGCGYVLEWDALPVTPGCTVEQALGDGEDFEMLLAVESARVSALLAAWALAFPGLPLTRIGRLVGAGAGECLHGGWEHFSKPLAC
ncbi:MAG: thiamine-phosphate kinase [Verrucomicrobia bacterium]|nr:thiamine-phosphate kinase [Verrucomicrobiota bacterium]